MGLFDGKKGVVLGVANDRSIAWAIAKEILEQGGECGFTHLPDKPDDPKQKNRRRVSRLTDDYENARFLVPMNVQQDDERKDAVGGGNDSRSAFYMNSWRLSMVI